MQRPLQPSEAAKLLGLEESGDEIGRLNDAVKAMFPLRNEKHYMAFHKSVVDYLVKIKTDESGCVHYHTYINPLDGHKLFATELQKQIDKTTISCDKTSKLDWTFPPTGSYVVAHLIHHLCLTGDVDDKAKARDLLFQLPWLMRVVEERGVASLQADCRKRQLTDLDAATGRQLKLLHDGIHSEHGQLLGSRRIRPYWLPVHLISRIRPLLTDKKQQQQEEELPLLRILVDECENWIRRNQVLFPYVFKLPCPGGILQTTLKIGSEVFSLATLSDGRMVSTSDDNAVRVWDFSEGKCDQVLQGHSCGVITVTVLTDGRMVSATDDSTIRVWDLSTGKCVQTLRGHTDVINSMAALSNSRVVSGSRDQTIRVWIPSTGKCVNVLEGLTSVTSVAVLSDGRLVSWGADYTIRLWDLSTWKCVAELEGHYSAVTSVAVLPDGRVVSGSMDKTIRIWNTSIGECMKVLQGHTNWINSLAVLSDGRVISASMDKTVLIWDPSTWTCARVLCKHTNWITTLAVLSDGRVVSGSVDKTVRVWDPLTWECEQKLKGVLSDGRVISESDDNMIRVWDLSTGESVQVPNKHTDLIVSVALLPGEMVGIATDERVRVWDPSTWEMGVVRVVDGST